MASQTLKFGLHDFLNARPLLNPLLETAATGGLEMVSDAPARLADRLRSGELDLAMIPSIEYLKRAGDYRLLPGVSIASRGPVGTVLLITSKPLEQVKKVALDERSRTSATLLRLLLGPKFSPAVVYESGTTHLALLNKNDAVLVIGDQAFQWAQRPDVTLYDLSEEWFRATGKTFVHAVVAVPVRTSLNASQIDLIAQARNRGLSMLEEIAHSESEKSGLDRDLCLDYLQNKIIYDLGENEVAGLKQFQERCGRQGLIDPSFSLEFVA